MVSWKSEIIDPLDTTATVFGGKTTNYILQYFKGIDLSELDTDPDGIADISTYTYFANNTLNLWDSNKENRIRIQVPDYDEDKTYLFPPEAATSSTEEFVFKDSVQILTNKTIAFGDNTISGITKASLPSSIVFNDQNNDLGAFYLDVTQIATPNSPVSGKRRIFVSQTTGKLSIRRSDGVVVSLEEGVFNTAGGFAAGGIATFSGDASENVFTIPHGMPQEPDVIVVYPMNQETASSIFHVDKDDDDLIVTFNTAPPDGTDNIVLNWGVGYVNPDALTFNATSVSTLSNKTLNVDDNIVQHSTTNNEGELLVYQTDRYNRFPLGTAGQVLAVNGAADAIEWADALTSSSTTTMTNKTIGDFITFSKQSAPSDPSSNTARTYYKQVDSNNDTITVKQKVNGAFIEVHAF